MTDPIKHFRVTATADVMLGKPVIHGTRIPVELILRKLGGGMPPSELLEAYPSLTAEDVLAAQAYAADCLPGERVIAAE
jgi:uncharacterized protein (DUF433 family)